MKRIGKERRKIGGGGEMKVEKEEIEKFGKKIKMKKIGDVEDKSLVVLIENMSEERKNKKKIVEIEECNVEKNEVNEGIGIEMMMIEIIDKSVEKVKGIKKEIEEE